VIPPFDIEAASPAAYFNQRTVDELTPIEDVPNVGRIPVPEGLFKSARAIKSKRDDPRRNAPGTPVGPDGYTTLSSGSGVLCTIFPSSGDGPQTTLAYTQDGSSRSHSLTPVSADPRTLARSTHPAAPAPHSPYYHSASSQTLSRHVQVPAIARSRGSIRSPPSLVPLEYLQTCLNTRDPTDERMVQQLSTSRTPNADPSRSPVSPGVNVGRHNTFQ
jgi:Gti1/Pac2 family transcription factor